MTKKTILNELANVLGSVQKLSCAERISLIDYKITDINKIDHYICEHFSHVVSDMMLNKHPPEFYRFITNRDLSDYAAHEYRLELYVMSKDEFIRLNKIVNTLLQITDSELTSPETNL